MASKSRTTQEEGQPTDGCATLLLGADASITVFPGSTILVQLPNNDTYGAVLVWADETTAELTFTPEGKPRKVPLGLVVCAVGDGSATIDLSSIPEYQPTPNTTPRRSRRVKANV